MIVTTTTYMYRMIKHTHLLHTFIFPNFEHTLILSPKQIDSKSQLTEQYFQQRVVQLPFNRNQFTITTRRLPDRFRTFSFPHTLYTAPLVRSNIIYIRNITSHSHIWFARHRARNNQPISCLLGPVRKKTYNPRISQGRHQGKFFQLT